MFLFMITAIRHNKKINAIESGAYSKRYTPDKYNW